MTTVISDELGQPIQNITEDDIQVQGEFADQFTVVDVQDAVNRSGEFAVVLVIDTSSSMAGPPIEAAQAAAQSFVEQLSPDSPVAIVLFNTDVTTALDFTTDREAINQTIETLPFGGQTALYDGALSRRGASHHKRPRAARGGAAE